MSTELILFVLLILFLIFVLYAFGYQETNVKHTQPSGSANQSSRPGETKGDNINQRNETKKQPKCSEETAWITEETLTRRRRATGTSGDSNSEEQNNVTEGMEITSDEYLDNENFFGEKVEVTAEQNIFREFVDKDILNQYLAKNGVLRGLMKFIKKNIEGWKKRKLNIAIIGSSGTGKSSLINAIRGLKPRDDKAAPVGVTETTVEKKKYEFPNNENIILWDLPGVGTLKFKREDYLNKMDIRGFDAFIIVSASRFTENEIWLASEIMKQKNCAFFVRTKVDIDLMNEERDHSEGFSVRSCLGKMRKDIRDNLKNSKMPLPKAGIFLVSSVDRDSHDFPDMLTKLSELLNSKGVSVKNLLQKYIQTVIMKRMVLGKNSFFWHKGASAVSSLWRLVNVNHVEILVIRMCKVMYKLCKKQFCLDQETLEKVSKEINIPVKILKEHHLQFEKTIESNKKYFSADFLGDVSKSCTLSEKLFPGYYFFTNRLHTACEILAADESTLVRLRLSRLVDELKPL